MDLPQRVSSFSNRRCCRWWLFAASLALVLGSFLTVWKTQLSFSLDLDALMTLPSHSLSNEDWFGRLFSPARDVIRLSGPGGSSWRMEGEGGAWGVDDKNAGDLFEDNSDLKILKLQKGEMKIKLGKKGEGEDSVAREGESGWAEREDEDNEVETSTRHLVFGFGSRLQGWVNRREIIRSWWKAKKMRGFVFMDQTLASDNDLKLEPKMMPSEDTSHFPYTHDNGARDALRLSRIVVELFRLQLPNVRWFVMGDDDTFFNAEALVAVLRKYDHTAPMLIGSTSETHLSKVWFGQQMAFGGGGFAISWPLAAALNATFDTCLFRYPELYSSDERVTACSAELGVRLTQELGFHQCDLFGSLEGFLEAHPLQPFISLHHIDYVEKLFPTHRTRAESLLHFAAAIPADPIGFLQQTVYHHREEGNEWTLNIAWGYSVKVFPGIVRMREMARAAITFSSWIGSREPEAFGIDTRYAPEIEPFRTVCGRPYVAYMARVRRLRNGHVLSTYSRYPDGNRTACPPGIDQVTTFHVIRKKPMLAPGMGRNGRMRGPNLQQECCKSITFYDSKKLGETVAVIVIGQCRFKEVIAA